MTKENTHNQETIIYNTSFYFLFLKIYVYVNSASIVFTIITSIFQSIYYKENVLLV